MSNAVMVRDSGCDDLGDVRDRSFRRLVTLIDEQGGLSRAAAETLFDLELDHRPTGADWQAFFIETLTDYVVWQARPTGVITSQMAAWLLEQADRSQTINAFALLVNVLVEAHLVPSSFPAAIRDRAMRWACVPEALRADESEAA